GASVFTLLVVLGPWAALGLAGLWSNGHRWSASAAALACAATVALVARGQGLDPRHLYVAEHAGAHLLLGLWFGSTLKAGRQPLICALAERLHGTLDAIHAAYTRRVTQVWTAYFFGMAAISVGLFVAGEFERWSFFANLVTPAAAILLFAGESVLRYRWHPEFDRVSVGDTIRAYRELRGGTGAVPGETQA
ncbi:MAG: hypothetical protein HOQ10_11445, partial [Frateuria sp.]|nr:hypothetical protein [Frateuria sp.]